MHRHLGPARASALLVTLLVPSAVCAQQVAAGKILEALNVTHGATVCEIGAGDGQLSIEAAKVVGPSGRVFSSELGESRIKALQQKVSASGLTQISVIAGDSAKTNFADAACDGVFMKDVYHHFAEPSVMNASIAAALKPGGRLVIIDFTPPPGSEAKVPSDRDNDGMHGITPGTLARELKEAGFEPVSTETSGRWFMVVVSTPKR